MKIFLLFCLLLSFATSAFGSWEEKWHKGKEDPGKPEYFSYSDTNYWANLWLGYSFCTLEDVRKSGTDWNNYFFGSGSSSAQPNEEGLNLGAEGGWQFDGLNGLSASFETIYVSPSTYSYSIANSNLSSVLQPTLYSFSLNFYHFIEQKADHQTYLCIGGGYYLSSVAFNEKETVGANTIFNTSSNWGAGAPGGTLGAGARINAGKNFGIQLDARGRYANFSRVTTNYSPDPSQPAYLSTLAVDSHGLIGEEPADSVGKNGNTDRFLDVDFSGFDLNVGIFYHF